MDNGSDDENVDNLSENEETELENRLAFYVLMVILVNDSIKFDL